MFFPVFPTLGVQNLFFPGRYLPVSTAVKTRYRPKPSNPVVYIIDQSQIMSKPLPPMEWLLMPYWLTRPLGHCQLYTLKFMLQSCRDMFLAENLPRGHIIWIEMCLIGRVNWGLVYSEYIWISALIHSSGAVDRILRLVELIPCLLMLWFPKSPKHQRVQHWLCRTENKHGCSRVHFIDLNQAKSKIWLKCEYIFNALWNDLAF